MSEEISRDLFFLNDHHIEAAEFTHRFNPPLAYSYEVFRVSQQVPLFIEDHLERFFNTAKLSGVETGTDIHQMMESIRNVIEDNPSGDGNIKMALYYDSNNKRQLFIYFTPHQYPSTEQYKEGVDVELYLAERNNPNAKVMNVAMRKSANETKQQHEVYELLLVDRNGFITEGSRSNVFFIKGNQLITPPADTVLEGITRKQILNLCKEHNIAWSEAHVHQSELSTYDALFISGTSRRVLPVKKVNDSIFDTAHPIIQKLQLLFENMVADYISKRK